MEPLGSSTAEAEEDERAGEAVEQNDGLRVRTLAACLPTCPPTCPSLPACPTHQCVDKRNANVRWQSVYNYHADSVYDVCWASGDAFVFASVSYDGQVAVNEVGSAEKGRILQG